MSDDRDSYFPLCSGDPVGAAALLVEKDKEIEQLRASERSAWNAAVMRDEEIERLRAELAELDRTVKLMATVQTNLIAERDGMRSAAQLASEILHGKHHDDQGRAYDAALEVLDAALAKEKP